MVKQFDGGSCQLKIYSKHIHANDKISKKISDKRLETISLNSDIDLIGSEWSDYVSKNRTIKNIYDLTRGNKWDYFLTFTLNENRTDRNNYDDCVKAVSDYFERIKKLYCKDLKYMIVPEYHKKGGFHFHGLLGNTNGLPIKQAYKHIKGGELYLDKNKAPVALKDQRGRSIYNLDKNIYGFTTLTEVTNNFAVCSYITKYITKELETQVKFRKRYICSKNLDRPDINYLDFKDKNIDKIIQKYNDKIKFMKSEDYGDLTVKYIEFSEMPKEFNLCMVNDDNGFRHTNIEFKDIL